jgi:hypothetical protein
VTTRPPEKIEFHMRTPAWYRKQAKGIGPARGPARPVPALAQRAGPENGALTGRQAA